MIQNILEKSVKQALEKLNILVEHVHLEHPVEISHGDYSSNVALVAVKNTKQTPKELAEKIVELLNQNKPSEIEKIEIAGPGFINFYLSRTFFANSIQEIIEKEKKWGSNKVLKGKKIMVEYTDPNPFKEFHIGHLMSNAIGESISRLIEFSGAEVKRTNYQGDVGLHVAKAVWGLKRSDIEPKDIETLGKAYAQGALAYEKDKKAKNEIDELNKKIYEYSDKEINVLYEKGKSISLAHFEDIYKRLGTTFDQYFFESQSGVFGIKVIEEGLKRDIFEKSEGAIVFHGGKYDPSLHTRVFVNSEGLPTYEAKELGLAKLKYDTYPYDVSIVVTGSEVNEYFKVILKAMEQMYPELAGKTRHVSHGMMRLPSGKISSRTGNVITAESLIDEVQGKIKEKMKGREVTRIEQISEQVAIGALKYSVLKQTTGKDIVFDFGKSLSFEGDSGPYLQYAYTRAQSILEKAKQEKVELNTKKYPKSVSELERLLYRFPEIVLRAQKEYEPHYLTTYLTELAGTFNSYYAQERIVDAKEYAQYKVALTRAFQITMQNGLWLLGIQAPEHM